MLNMLYVASWDAHKDYACWIRISRVTEFKFKCIKGVHLSYITSSYSVTLLKVLKSLERKIVFILFYFINNTYIRITS